MMVPSRHDLTPGETGTVAGMPLSLWELVGLHAMSLQVLSHPLPPPPLPQTPPLRAGNDDELGQTPGSWRCEFY